VAVGGGVLVGADVGAVVALGVANGGVVATSALVGCDIADGVFSAAGPPQAASTNSESAITAKRRSGSGGRRCERVSELMGYLGIGIGAATSAGYRGPGLVRAMRGNIARDRPSVNPGDRSVVVAAAQAKPVSPVRPASAVIQRASERSQRALHGVTKTGLRA